MLTFGYAFIAGSKLWGGMAKEFYLLFPRFISLPHIVFLMPYANIKKEYHSVQANPQALNPVTCCLAVTQPGHCPNESSETIIDTTTTITTTSTIPTVRTIQYDTITHSSAWSPVNIALWQSMHAAKTNDHHQQASFCSIIINRETKWNMLSSKIAPINDMDPWRSLERIGWEEISLT